MSSAEVEKTSLTSSVSSSTSSLVKLDELSAFGATKNGRLPALIKLNPGEEEQTRQAYSMPVETAEQLEREQVAQQQHQQASLPATQQHQHQLHQQQQQQQQEVTVSGGLCEDEKENGTESDGFQLVGAMGPSLPQARIPADSQLSGELGQSLKGKEAASWLGKQASIIGNSSGSLNNRESNSQVAMNQPSHLGDSLIEMIVSLRNENQNLVRALETNNEYVKERISEFKRLSEEARKRETQFSLEKADMEHQARKMKRQNLVLSERLKSMEAKLRDMRVEVGDSLAAALASQSSSVRSDQQQQLYPDLSGEPDSFQMVGQASTLQVDATPTLDQPSPVSPSAPMDTSVPVNPSGSSSNAQQTTAQQLAGMTREELAARFEPDKARFYALDEPLDPMKQCDQLEQQLNAIGKRDYEICLLQQQLNIYRQDFRLERMANLEAKIQIERLKSDIDRLCLERIQADQSSSRWTPAPEELTRQSASAPAAGRQRGHHSVRFEPSAVAGEALGRIGQSLNRRAAKQAAKAAKHAAKVAHREEKAASRAAPATASPSDNQQQSAGHRSSRGAHHGVPRSGIRAVRSEVMNDLLSTANKAMLTGYKMASTHVNLALDKLSAFEQAQASNLAAKSACNSEQTGNSAGTKPSGPPSVD